jgi:hypothetical protein
VRTEACNWIAWLSPDVVFNELLGVARRFQVLLLTISSALVDVARGHREVDNNPVARSAAQDESVIVGPSEIKEINRFRGEERVGQSRPP